MAWYICRVRKHIPGSMSCPLAMVFAQLLAPHLHLSCCIVSLFSIAKTVPKYCTAIFIKDYLEQQLPQADPSSSTYNSDRLYRSAIKSATAGVAGAALTNPLDVIRNEMFKSNASLSSTVRQLYDELGYGFLHRGLAKNMIAVAIPVSCTIFFTDVLIQLTTPNNDNGSISHSNHSPTYGKKIKLKEGGQQ